MDYGYGGSFPSSDPGLRHASESVSNRTYKPPSNVLPVTSAHRATCTYSEIAQIPSPSRAQIAAPYRAPGSTLDRSMLDMNQLRSPPPSLSLHSKNCTEKPSAIGTGTVTPRKSTKDGKAARRTYKARPSKTTQCVQKRKVTIANGIWQAEMANLLDKLDEKLPVGGEELEGVLREHRKIFAPRPRCRRNQAQTRCIAS